MPNNLNLTVILVFVASVVVLVGAGLFILALVLKAKNNYRRRLSRVSRRRVSGRLDLDDARLNLLRQKQESDTLVAFSNAMAKFVPLLDTVRLRANIRRAGMTMPVSTFIVLSLLAAGVLAAALHLVTGYPLPVLVPPALFAGMLIVDNYVKIRGNIVTSRFMKQLPNAIDTIIRGIRSGLPVIECIGNVGQEFDDPIGQHFKTISERVQLGEPLDAALWRVARVVNRPEMDFLAVSIAIQMETGGSLAEALGNLADLLRKRQQMKLKIKAISSEAKASALIIGALPFVMMGLLTVMSPDYVMPLFTDPRGHLMLAAALGSIGVGAFVMWRMTQFEI